MKTAEEWEANRWDKFEKGVSLKQWIRAIQADALRHAESIICRHISYDVALNDIRKQASILEKEGK